MRIILGILALCVALWFLDAPLTRGLTDWVRERVTAWFSEPAPGTASVSAAAPATRPAPNGCYRAEVKSCDIRKRHSCGPMTLEFSVDTSGASHCDRATLLLPPAQVIPLLRQVRCLLVGADTRIRFAARNYQPQQGPRDGDTLEVHNGSGDVVLYGHYERTDELAEVTLENIGPGSSVVLKCEAFGPA